MEREGNNIDDDFEDLSQIPPSDVNGPSVQQASPYFSGGSGGAGKRRTSGYKRKRGGGKASGEKKLTKRGQWLGKRSTNGQAKGKAPSSAARTPASGSRPSYGGAAGYRAGAPSTSGGAGMGLLAPPRPRAVKRD